MPTPSAPQIKLDESIKGAPIFNDWAAWVGNSIMKCMYPSSEGNIRVTSTPMGLSFAVPQFPVGLALTTGTITARSGTTIGSGTADLKLLANSGTTLTIVADAARTAQRVYNFSASGTIASGKYIIWMKILGYYFVVSTEC